MPAWVWIELIPLTVITYGFYMAWIGKRVYKLGQVMWFKPTIPSHSKWTLAVVIKESGYPNVRWVRPLDSDKVECAGAHDMRPIWWWQRRKTDPIIMKHVLLEGELV